MMNSLWFRLFLVLIFQDYGSAVAHLLLPLHDDLVSGREPGQHRDAVGRIFARLDDRLMGFAVRHRPDKRLVLFVQLHDTGGDDATLFRLGSGAEAHFGHHAGHQVRAGFLHPQLHLV